MQVATRIPKGILSTVIAAAILIAPSLALALQPPEDTGESPPDSVFVFAPHLKVNPAMTVFEMGDDGTDATSKPGVQSFFDDYTEDWTVIWDERSDRPHLFHGRGIPMLPGRGNYLRQDELGFDPREEIQLTHVEQILRTFIDEHPEFFGVVHEDLVLREDLSGNFGDRKQLWFVEFQRYHAGIPVEGASVFFRLNHGNLVQFGTNRVDDVMIDTYPAIDAEAALSAVVEQLGRVEGDVAHLINPGELKIYPQLLPSESVGHLYEGAPGEGYDYSLMWELILQFTDDEITYKALVDAKTGVVTELIDNNWYATVKGGIYPETYTDTEITVPFPFARVYNNGVKVTDVNGYYSYTYGTTATCNLDGIYTNVNDNCGAISLSNSTNGNLDFGTSGGTNCTTPGVGGAGNTHSARNAFYHLTTLNRIAASYHPTNAWLGTNLTANTNINNVCNAYWNGTSVNFFRSGSGCGNTGEIAAVLAHEWGHGFDQNTGNTADRGSGEAVGDTCAMLYTHNSCIGPAFQPGVNCYNCTNCDGVRDPAEFGLWGSATIASPSTVASNTGINCDRYTCPYWGYSGVMGYQGHCESYIASSAIWDLGVMLRNALGQQAGWDTLEQIWYDSMPLTQSAYQLIAGGQCNPNATVNGCAANNYYWVFLVVDDDNGNLADGTPHGCLIWDALSAHGIHCWNRPPCSDCITTTTVYTENLDDGVANGFTLSPDMTNLWHPANDCYAAYSSPYKYLFSQYKSTGCDYNLGQRVKGTTTSPVINVSGYSCARLEFRNYWETESWPGAFDVMRVEATTNGGVTWNTVGYWDSRDSNPSGYQWFNSSNLSTPSGTIQFRFTFDTIDSLYNNYLGWVVDNMEIKAGN